MRQLSKRPKSQIGANEEIQASNEECKISNVKEKVILPEPYTWQDSCVKSGYPRDCCYLIWSL